MSRYFLTTPIFYVNDAPHIGHAYTVLNGDAISRWQRLLSEEAFYLTGTDEHGLKVQGAAETNGLSPLEQADGTSQGFWEAWGELGDSPRYHVHGGLPVAQGDALFPPPQGLEVGSPTIPEHPGLCGPLA